MRANAGSPSRSQPRTPGAGALDKHSARSGIRRLQNVTGLLLLASAAAGVYLLATDRSLWLLAVSHAVGLVVIVVIDLALAFLSFTRPKSAYLPSVAAGVLGVTLQLGDVFTAPQYGMAVAYFAHYLFGLWAFDILLGLQVAVLAMGVAGRPYARFLARRKSRRGAELNYSRRSFMKSVAAIAGLVGLGVVLGSVKLPPPASTQNSTPDSGSGLPAGAIANKSQLKVGAPVYFNYPKGYPNMLTLQSDGTLLALSLLCTHVCCRCTVDTAAKEIYCPCHGSLFDSNGRVLRGPAVAPLPTVTLNVDSGGYVYPTGIRNPGPCHP
jgi:Rieske Fe-S protein